MTPIRLKMQAFGPYQGAVEIAFSGLRGKLFLITGSTGGGKTTILRRHLLRAVLPGHRRAENLAGYAESVCWGRCADGGRF